MVKLYCLCWNYSFFWLTYHCSIGLCFSVRVWLSLFRSTCKLIQSLFLQWFVKSMGSSLLSLIISIVFFLGLIITCRLWVIYVREDNYYMYRLWLHGLYGLYGPRCPLSPKRPIDLISPLSLNPSMDKKNIRYKVWDEMTFPFANFNGAFVGV